MNTKEITYEDYSRFSGKSALTLDEALDLFDKMDWKEGAFYYFDINTVNTLQLYRQSERFLVEITNDSDDMIFLQRYATREDARQWVSHFFGTDHLGDLEGFYQVAINTTTLDKVMKANK